MSDLAVSGLTVEYSSGGDAAQPAAGATLRAYREALGDDRRQSRDRLSVVGRLAVGAEQDGHALAGHSQGPPAATRSAASDWHVGPAVGSGEDKSPPRHCRGPQRDGTAHLG
jgi:hypothetical protein